MTLYLDTTNPAVLWVALVKGDQIITQTVKPAKFRQSEKLLITVDAVLIKQKIKLAKITGIVVVRGPGPFTATRIGVATANALAFALRIPVAGVKRPVKFDYQNIISLGQKQLSRTKKYKPVLPLYDGEPNITVRKARNV